MGNNLTLLVLSPPARIGIRRVTLRQLGASVSSLSSAGNERPITSVYVLKIIKENGFRGFFVIYRSVIFNYSQIIDTYFCGSCPCCHLESNRVTFTVECYPYPLEVGLELFIRGCLVRRSRFSDSGGNFPINGFLVTDSFNAVTADAHVYLPLLTGLYLYPCPHGIVSFRQGEGLG